jgi:hypothetical protein
MNDIACDIALVSNSKSLASLGNPARSDYGYRLIPVTIIIGRAPTGL